MHINIDLNGWIALLLIGLIAGFLAGQIFKGSGFGILGNIIIGIIGAVLGAVLFNAMGIAPAGLIGAIITATVGAVVLLFLLSLATGKKK